MNIKLNSDFIDYYDTLFCNSPDINNIDVVLNRRTKTKRTRCDDFIYLREARFYIPDNGIITPFISSNKYKYVVYLNEYAHKGEDKILVDRNELSLYSGKYYSIYIESRYAYHWRLLAIGKFRAWLKYTSDHEWMSNKGNVSIELVQWGIINDERVDYLQDILDTPLIAIDGRYFEGNFVAFDLNTAPQIKGTPIEFIYSKEFIYNHIKQFYER